MKASDLQPTANDLIIWASQNDDGGLEDIQFNGGPRGQPTQAKGFDKIVSTPLSKGGEPFPRAGINGAFNFVHKRIISKLVGYVPHWTDELANSAGGIAQGCEMLVGGHKYRSLQDNNKDHPVGSPKWRQLD